MRNKRYSWLVIVFVLVMLVMTGCSNTQETSVSKTESESSEQTVNASDKTAVSQASRDIFAMDTYMTVTAYGQEAEAAVDAAIAEIERLDALLSTGNDDSEIAKLNAAGSGQLSEDAAALVERALVLGRETDGAFDIAIYPVMEAWGFTSQNYAVPTETELDELLDLADISLIDFDSETSEVSFRKTGVRIDLGGIAKGFTSARIMDIFREYGIESGMVDLGGNVQVMGSKTDGSPWRVAIQSPDDENGYLGILSTENRAVITSGGYERYFEQDGVVYHHIIDPATGYPADSGLVSVTIVSADGTLADGLSTSLFIMGKDKAVDYWRAHSEEFDMILLDDEGILYISEGIEDAFISESEIQIIEKDGER